MADWETDLSDSAYDFNRLVWPVIKMGMGGGELVAVETVANNDFAKQLDLLSGIDAWHVQEGCGLRGIASRVQWGDKCWETFTIRMARDSGAATEYQKRLNAIESTDGWLYPVLTVQAYVTTRRTGKLLGCAVARTVDIIQAVKDGHCDMRHVSNATFSAVDWTFLDEDPDCEISIYCQ